MNKRGQTIGLASLITVIIIFLVVGVLSIYSIDMLDSAREDFCDYNYDEADGICFGCLNATYPNYNSSDDKCYNGTTGDLIYIAATVEQASSFNSTSDAIEGVGKAPEKMPTLGNVVIAAIIIGVLLAAFGGVMAMKQFNT